MISLSPLRFCLKSFKKLSEYSWPGNVRQLENTCYWLALMAPSKDIQPSDLPRIFWTEKFLIQAAMTGEWIQGLD